MSKKALTGAERKAAILEAGAKLASKHGAVNVTRRMVAAAAGVSEALVSNHMGDTPTAQKAYRRKAKAMGLAEPSKADIEAIGVKLRAHGPRDKRDTRKRSAREVEAIKRKGPAVTKKQAASLPKGKRANPAKREVKPARAPARSPAKAPVTKPAPGRSTKPAPRYQTKTPPPGVDLPPPLANTFP